MNEVRPVEILLVEDNEGDVLLITEAFEEARIANTISNVRDGEEAMQYLTRSGKYASELMPDIILLDINLPKRNGHEVLEFIKSNADLKHIPVIMLTTSSSEEDVMKAYAHHVNCFITKPVDAPRFLEAINRIEDFWLSIVHLPQKSSRF